jgi:hypothetical protein
MKAKSGSRGVFSPFGVPSCVPFSAGFCEIGVFDSASGVGSGPTLSTGVFTSGFESPIYVALGGKIPNRTIARQKK